MCIFCSQYGDPKHGNGLWYLNPKNYARNMYKLREPGEEFKGAEAGLETGRRPAGPTVADLIRLADEGNFEEYNKIQKALVNRGQGSQVVPLADADKVLELSFPIGLIACICRNHFRAIEERNEHEYTCMGMGVGMLKWERWPERYKGGVAFVDIDEAKEWNHEMDRRGFVHILMLFGAPYIGGFCQCDYPTCGALRHAIDFGTGVIKGHYVAVVDYNKCNGCGVCVQRCQWGALKFEVTIDKANIDLYKCFGCGLCQTGCPRGAITLVERGKVPAVAEVWR
ncbi:MAG: 4Fe-4S binding protein [Dehalococcoidales bacterium]|nr:4Fe-4S binding protein [Dehalococcoidales bacterium]